MFDLSAIGRMKSFMNVWASTFELFIVRKMISKYRPLFSFLGAAAGSGKGIGCEKVGLGLRLTSLSKLVKLVDFIILLTKTSLLSYCANKVDRSTDGLNSGYAFGLSRKV
jgi:hypothetical protein